MSKLFPNSIEYIKTFAFEKNEIKTNYKINNRKLISAFESIHQQHTDCSFVELNTDYFLTNANKFLCNQDLEPQQEEYFKKLLNNRNNWEGYIGIPKNSNYDFIAMLIVFKHLLDEGDIEILDLEQYINTILIKVHTKFFEIEIEFDDDEGSNIRVINFIPDNFSYTLIEDETFMSRYFYDINKKSFFTDLSSHFDKFPYHFDNYKFLELALSKKEITNTLMQNESFKSKANRFFTIKPDALIKVLHKNGSLLEFLPEGLKSNFDLVNAAINNDPNAYLFADDSLKRDSKIINLLLQKGFLEILPDEIKNNEELARISILFHPNTISHAGNNIRKNKDLLLFSLKTYSNLDIIPKELLDDIEFMTKVLFLQPRKYRWFLEKLPSIFQNKEACRKVLEYEGSALLYFSEDKINDPHLVTIAVKDDISNIKYAGKTIRTNKQFMYELVNQNNIAYCYFEDEMKQDYELALNIIYKSPEAYSYLPNQFKNDPKIMSVLLDSIFNSHLTNSGEWPKLEDYKNQKDVNDIIDAFFGDDLPF